MAENMMDLIDGYCRMENDTDDSVIYRPNKGVYGAATSSFCFLNVAVVKAYYSKQQEYKR